MMSNAGFKSLLSLVLWVAISAVSSAAYAKSYGAELRAWSRHKQLYSITDAHVKIIAKATYFSPEFRQIFVARHIKKKFLKDFEANAFIEEQQGRQKKGHEFFVAIYSPKSYRIFTSGKDTFWEAVLTTASGERLKAESVTPVDVTPYERTMFSYLDRWSKAYRVIFPKVELGEEVELTLRSVVGETHLKWN